MRMVLAMLACPATWALALRPARRLARRAFAAGTRLDDASPYAIDERPVDVEAVGALAARHVARHGDWLAARPVARHTAAAFDAFLAAAAGRPEVVVDAGCGTGVSTAALAARHPDALVVGVDRSADRLGRGRAPLPDNAFLLRAELADFWRLCAALRGTQIFNPTSMCKYATSSTPSLRSCFENLKSSRFVQKSATSTSM